MPFDLSALDFPQLLILILLGLLFFKETLLQWVGEAFAAIRGVEPVVVEQVPAWAEQLMAYFNHDTTGHHEETHKKLETLTEIARDNNVLLKNIDKYGIKCRQDV